MTEKRREGINESVFVCISVFVIEDNNDFLRGSIVIGNPIRSRVRL